MFPVLVLPVLFAATLRAAVVDSALPRYVPQSVEFPQGARFVTANGAIAIVGYNDMAEMITALNARFEAAHPGFKFAPVLKGTRTGPPALAQGESAFAPMGADFSPDELEAYRTATGSEPLRFRVAHCSLNPRALSGPLAIIVHKGSPLTSLTLTELAEIFSGRGTRGLHPCGLAADKALGIFFRDRVLAGAGFGAEFRGFAQSADVVRRVAADPAAIGFAASIRANGDVKILALASDLRPEPVPLTEESIRAGRYPLDRFLLIYVRRPVEPVAREYLRLLLSREGQQAIADGALGYLPLTATEAAAELAKLTP